MYSFMLINVKTKTKWMVCLGKHNRSQLTEAHLQNVRRALAGSLRDVCTLELSPPHYPKYSRAFQNLL